MYVAVTMTMRTSPRKFPERRIFKYLIMRARNVTSKVGEKEGS